MAEPSESAGSAITEKVGRVVTRSHVIVQFDEAGLLERCHGRHHRFTQESRERRGTGFFGRLPRGGRFCHVGRSYVGWSFDDGDRCRDWRLLDAGTLQAGIRRVKRGCGLGGRLGLQEPGQRELLVLFLVLLAVSLGAELAPAPQALEEGKLLPAEKTLHTSLDRHVGPDAQEGT